MHFRTTQFALTLCLIGTLSACREAPTAAELAGPGEREMQLDVPVARGLYIPLDSHQPMGGMKQSLAAGDPPQIIYMHRGGGTYFGGSEDSSQNRSTVVGSGSVVVTAFGGGDTVWNQVMDCVTDVFAPFNATVTDVEPTSGDYIESVVGGNPTAFGFPGGVGGVAPIDSFSCNIISDAIVYTFSEVLPNDSQLLCEIAAQEIGHALSLDHELLCTDPMTYLSGCGAKEFRDFDADCGEYSTRACVCNRPKQNSVQILLDKLGPNVDEGGGEDPPPPEDDVLPEVSLLSPTDNEDLPENTYITIIAEASDNTSLAAVELVWAFSNTIIPCPSSGGGYSCTASGDRYEWSLNVGTGDRTFSVQARDTAGNQAVTELHTIHLTADAPPQENPDPPPDEDPPPDGDVTPPEITITDPVDDAVLPSGTPLMIRAAVYEEGALASVNLLWEYTGDSFPCPTEQEDVSCTVEDDVYTWLVSSTPGVRRFQIRAVDVPGNQIHSAIRSVTLSETAPPPADDDDYEPNDLWQEGTEVPCGTGIDLIALPGDEDWLRVSVVPGVEVSIFVRSENGLDTQLTEGPLSNDVLQVAAVWGESTLSAVSKTGEVGLRVRNLLDEAAGFRAVISCGLGDEIVDPEDTISAKPVKKKEGEEKDPIAAFFDCTQGDSASAWPIGLAFLLLLGRRRRS